MKITQKEIDSIIIIAYYTDSGNVWIDGIMGGGIEWTDSGRKYHNLENAKKHYCKKYFEYCKKYKRGIIWQATETPHKNT